MIINIKRPYQEEALFNALSLTGLKNHENGLVRRLVPIAIPSLLSVYVKLCYFRRLIPSSTHYFYYKHTDKVIGLHGVVGK